MWVEVILYTNKLQCFYCWLLQLAWITCLQWNWGSNWGGGLIRCRGAANGPRTYVAMYLFVIAAHKNQGEKRLPQSGFFYQIMAHDLYDSWLVTWLVPKINSGKKNTTIQLDKRCTTSRSKLGIMAFNRINTPLFITYISMKYLLFRLCMQGPRSPQVTASQQHN